MVSSTLRNSAGRLAHLGHVGVGHLLDALHSLYGGFGAGNGSAEKQTAEPLEVLLRLPHPQADKRVAAAQVVVEKRERRADGEAVQPQRDLGQLDGERVLVHAVDAALEHHAADDGLVGELRLLQNPLRCFGPAQDVVADRRYPAHQRRFVLAVEPLGVYRRVLDQAGDVVGQIVDRRDQKVAAAHRRVEYLEIEHRLGRVQLAQLGHAFGLGAAVAL